MTTPTPLIALTQAGGSLNIIRKEHIMYAQAQSNLTKVVLTDGQTIVLTKILKNVLTQLASPEFIRIHNSYIVNINYVYSYTKINHKHELQLSNGSRIPISLKYKSQFLDAFKII